MTVNSPCAGVTVLRARTPVDGASFADAQLALLEPLQRQSLSELGVREAVACHTHIGRGAVVHQGPKHLNAVSAGCIGGMQQTREIDMAVTVRRADAPADALSDGFDAHRGDAQIVGIQLRGVAGEGSHVERVAVQVDVVGAFKTSHSERCKWVGGDVGEGGDGGLRHAACVDQGCSSRWVSRWSVARRHFSTAALVPRLRRNLAQTTMKAKSAKSTKTRPKRCTA